MNQRRADQPGHEGGILHRIPEPVAAPAKLVVSPPTAKADTDGQKRPRDRRPRSHPSCPLLIEFAFNHRGAGKGKCDREADIARVQHRRMRSERRILQQGVEITPIGRRWPESLKGIGRREREQQEAHRNQTHHTEYARCELHWQGTREQRHGERPSHQDPRPQQQRAFVCAPHRRNSIQQRQRRVRIRGDVEHREIVLDERVDECGQRHARQRKLRVDCGSDRSHPTGLPLSGPHQTEERLRECGKQRQHQRKMSKFDDHV